MKPDWFPDWSDRVCAVVASGPSAKKVDLRLLRDRVATIAIKESAYDLCRWADVAYGCDAAWWLYRLGFRDFKGIKVSWSGSNLRFPDIKALDIDVSQDRVFPKEKRKYRMIFDRPGTVGGGGNSGYQAVNLAAQFGAKRILLIGFDMHDRSGAHWYGRNNWHNGNNPDEATFHRWIEAFNVAAVDLAEQHIEVINVSPMSALKCFPHRTLEAALKGWGL